MKSRRQPEVEINAGNSHRLVGVLWLLLGALVALRAAVSLLPGSWLWGVDALRYLPAWAWLLWSISAVSVIPPISRKVEPLVGNIGRFVELSVAGRMAAAGLAALLVFSLADQLRYVGDFLLRQGSVEQTIGPSRIYPQALPLDVALHYQLPTRMMESAGLDPNLTARVSGAIAAAVLALLSIAFARRLAARGATLVAVAAVLWFGGWLLLFTGYAKAFSEMTLVILAAAVLGLDVLRGRRSYLWFALLAAGAIWLHRSALGLLPAVVLLAVMSRRARPSRSAPPQKGKRGRIRPKSTNPAVRLSVALGLILVFGSIAVITPKLLASFKLLDAAHFSLAGGGRAGGLPALISPLRLLDDFNLILFLVPLAPVALLIPFLRAKPEVIKAGEGWFLLALSLPYLLLVMAMQPAQGLFRDFDTMAMSGMAIAIAVAVVVSAVMKKQRAAAWLTVAVALGSAVPVLQSLLLSADLDRGLRRIESWIEGPPGRPEEVRAKTWDYVGVRNFRAGRYQQATGRFARAVELAPSPRIVAEWATAAEMADDAASAKQAFTLLLQRAPDDPQLRLTALVGLARCAQDDGDMQTFAYYGKQAIEMAPQNPVVRQLARQLAEMAPADSLSSQ